MYAPPARPRILSGTEAVVFEGCGGVSGTVEVVFEGCGGGGGNWTSLSELLSLGDVDGMV